MNDYTNVYMINIGKQNSTLFNLFEINFSGKLKLLLFSVFIGREKNFWIQLGIHITQH